MGSENISKRFLAVTIVIGLVIGGAIGIMLYDSPDNDELVEAFENNKKLLEDDGWNTQIVNNELNSSLVKNYDRSAGGSFSKHFENKSSFVLVLGMYEYQNRVITEREFQNAKEILENRKSEQNKLESINGNLYYYNADEPLQYVVMSNDGHTIKLLHIKSESEINKSKAKEIVSLLNN